MTNRQEQIDQAEGEYTLATHEAWDAYQEARKAMRMAVAKFARAEEAAYAEYERRLAEIEEEGDE